MIDWRAIQARIDPETKQALAQVGVAPRYMSMGSWHARLSKQGIYWKRTSGGPKKRI